MNAYACTECRWQYDWTMGDRVKAVKRHQLAHLVQRYGWRSNIQDAVDALLAASEPGRDAGASRAFERPRGPGA